MAEEKKEEKVKKEGSDLKITFLALIAVVLVAVAVIMLGIFPGPGVSPDGGPDVDQISTPMAKLFLASFDSGAKISEGEFFLNYSINDNGDILLYELSGNMTDSRVRETGDFGYRDAFFGEDNSTDVLCLAYGNERKCARTGTDEMMLDIAKSMNLFLPTSGSYIAEKENVRKLIVAGAIKFIGEPVDESIEGFDTRKITYSLNYRNLTVQTLISLGISPNDATLLSLTDQKVSYWIDKETGMVVKSMANYKENLVPRSYSVTYHGLSAKANKPFLEAPVSIVSTSAFVQFYQDASDDYREKATCVVLGGIEKDQCLKSLAAEKRDWEVCKLIEDKEEYERCTLVIAQMMNNHILCEKLEMYSDDCYIAVVSKTGNFELCKNIKNKSLVANCTVAASQGLKIKEGKEEAYRLLYDQKGCEIDSGCKVAGNAGQYCVPQNSTGSFAEETSPMFACLENVQCGCVEGLCSFKKNETYYGCIGEIENDAIAEYIDSIAKNRTAESEGVPKVPVG